MPYTVSVNLRGHFLNVLCHPAEAHYLKNTMPQDIVYTPGHAHYLKIIFTGDFSDIDFQDITYDIYNNILPELNIIRHPEHPDTEEYIFQENITELNRKTRNWQSG